MSCHAKIVDIHYYLPENTRSTEDLGREFPTRPVEQIARKTGIKYRHVAGDTEFTSDLAVAAAERLFESSGYRARDVEYILLCTQTPDQLIPTTACLVQDRLRIPISSGALDFTLGCSGYVYGLGLAESLIHSKQARTVLLLTSDTMSKYIDGADYSCKAIFGDAASATLLVTKDLTAHSIGPFVYGTDGSGASSLVLRNGGCRQFANNARQSGEKCLPTLQMDGLRMFEFASSVVPGVVHELLRKAGVSLADVDLFVFHQANAYLLEAIRLDLGIPKERLLISLADSGNTVSSTIPIALKQAFDSGKLKAGQLVMLIGFGVGFSWSATMVRWSDLMRPAPS